MNEEQQGRPESKNKPWVLVVDDNRSARVLAERFLKRHGYQVKTAATVQDALVELDKNRIYSAVVADWLFYDHSDGLKMLEAIRKWYRQYEIGLVLWTVDPAGCVLAKDAGIACVTKGEDWSDLIKAVEAETSGFHPAA